MARTGERYDESFILYEVIYNTGAAPRLIWYYFYVDSAGVRSAEAGGADAGGAGHESGHGYGRESEHESGHGRPDERPTVRLYYGNSPEMLGGAGVETNGPPWSYQLTVYDRSYRVPRWLRNGVIYQIFPDRFHRERAVPLTQADVEKKRPDYIYHADWNEPTIHTPDPRTGEIMNNDFYGGNLAGIKAKLPYLKDLGISIIYLNPIFESYSNHRYDTGDYKKIDELLGTDEDFRTLCAEALRYGIRIILDGSFNHTGSDSLYFNKDGYYDSVGAYQSSESKYYQWYSFDKYPDKYKCWWGILTLPGVNESDPEYTNYIISDEDSVVKRWLRQGASGWRLDVVDELPGAFVKLLRKHIKETDGDAVVIGEVWEDASNKVSYGEQREYLLGNELDSVMNYVLKNVMIAYVLGNISAARFDAENRKLAENYPTEAYYSLMNLIGGHDVVRILTILSEPPANLTRDQRAMHKPTLRKHMLGLRRLKLLRPGRPALGRRLRRRRLRPRRLCQARVRPGPGLRTQVRGMRGLLRQGPLHRGPLRLHREPLRQGLLGRRGFRSEVLEIQERQEREERQERQDRQERQERQSPAAITVMGMATDTATDTVMGMATDTATVMGMATVTVTASDHLVDLNRERRTIIHDSRRTTSHGQYCQHSKVPTQYRHDEGERYQDRAPDGGRDGVGGLARLPGPESVGRCGQGLVRALLRLPADRFLGLGGEEDSKGR
jgi:hypothetical protein